ncbi:trans-Golgi network integral membrane protein 2-like isoform X2 [Haliotis rufescens]|uniref:trans-Golgi network integral membrane protein 2-like isoform X2 n=1 Tax=Haliotis rufescens TaxID=6454 RepID=UPI00201F116A|nr:trans-Golgi network integral membrane protein 2-like isoform X2 [Haliotis rufescens]
MAATNRRDGVRIGLMLLLLTVSYIRAQDEPQDEEDDWFAEFRNLRDSCKFPMLSLGFLTEPSGKFYYEVCETTQPGGDLSRLCKKMFDLTLYMCNQTQVSEQKKKTIDRQMTSELMKFDKDETPFCTRLERDRNSSRYLGTYLPKDMNCETACKKNVAEKLCEFNFFSVIVYEKIAAGPSGRESNRGGSSTGPIGDAGDNGSANVGSTTPPLAKKSNDKTVTVGNKEGDTNIEVNNTGSPLNGSHASVLVNGSAGEPKRTDVDIARPVVVDKTHKTTVKVEGGGGKGSDTPDHRGMTNDEKDDGNGRSEDLDKKTTSEAGNRKTTTAGTSNARTESQTTVRTATPPATEGRDGLSGKDSHKTLGTEGGDGLSGKENNKTLGTEGGDGLSGKENNKTPAIEGGDGLSGKENHKTPAIEGGDGLSGKENNKTPAIEGGDGLSGKENYETPAIEGGDGLSVKDSHKTLGTEGGDGLSGKENNKTLGTEGGDGLSGKENNKTPAIEGGDGLSGKENHKTPAIEGGDGLSGKENHDTDSDFSEPGDGREQPVVHSDTAKSPEQIKKLEKEYEAPSSGNFMAYFLTAVVLCIAGYVVFHNKQKIIAFVIEGRSGQGRRRTNGSGEYKKLQSNVEESV